MPIIPSGTTNYTLTTAYIHCRVNANSSVFTVYLPPASGFIGQELSVIKIDSSTNAVTLSPAQSSSDTVNGASSLTTQWQSVRLRSTGTAWEKT